MKVPSKEGGLQAQGELQAKAPTFQMEPFQNQPHVPQGGGVVVVEVVVVVPMQF
jgi:hypothetical protein